MEEVLIHSGSSRGPPGFRRADCFSCRNVDQRVPGAELIVYTSQQQACTSLHALRLVLHGLIYVLCTFKETETGFLNLFLSSQTNSSPSHSWNHQWSAPLSLFFARVLDTWLCLLSSYTPPFAVYTLFEEPLVSLIHRITEQSYVFNTFWCHPWGTLSMHGFSQCQLPPVGRRPGRIKSLDVQNTNSAVLFSHCSTGPGCRMKQRNTN